MLPIAKIKELRELELKIAEVMDGRTSAEIRAIVGCTENEWDRFLQYHRKGRIRNESTGQGNKQRYYFVESKESFIEFIKTLRMTEKKCVHCGIIKPVSLFSYEKGCYLTDSCKECTKRNAEEKGIVCRDCGRTLPARCFAKASNGMTGRAVVCTDCKKVRAHDACGKVAGMGFRSWAIIDTSVHLAEFDRLGYELWGEPIPDDKVFERRRR